MEGESQDKFHKALLRPASWMVECPICGSEVEVEAQDDDYGAWGGREQDQFPECSECHALIEVVPVKIVEAYPA
jgi:hypothetical protein